MPIVKLTTATIAFAGAHDYKVRRGGVTKYPRGHSTMAQNLKVGRTYD